MASETNRLLSTKRDNEVVNARDKYQPWPLVAFIVLSFAVLGTLFDFSSGRSNHKSQLVFESASGATGIVPDGRRSGEYGGDLLTQPPIVQSTDGKLEATLIIDINEISFSNGVSFHTRTYNNTFPGPTFIVNPGDTLSITVDNRLGPEVESELTRPSNTFRLPNTTNLHVHGMHVDPSGKADNIFRTIHPGSRETYVYVIPENHPAGTFYLHPHFHGSSAYQYGYAMLSTIVVKERDEEGDGLAIENKNASNEAGQVNPTEDLVMMISQIDMRFPTSSKTSLLHDAEMIGDRLQLDVQNPNYESKFLVINGQYNSTSVVNSNQLYRWRIVNSVMDGYLRFSFRSKSDDSNREPCKVAEIAADGISYAAKRTIDDERQVVIPPGSRRDLIVQCVRDAELVSAPSFGPDKVEKFIGKETKVATGTLLNIVVDEKRRDLRSPPTFDAFDLYELQPSTPKQLYNPEPMGDLLEASVLDINRRTIHYTQGGPNTPKEKRADGNLHSFLGFDGKLFGEGEPLVVPLDTVVELTIVNDKCMDGSPAYESHPWHLHTNHFQIANFSSVLGNVYSPEFKVGDWRDTITIPAPGSVTVRFVARDYVGDTVMHCHTLAHEDAGMAMIVRIV